MKTEEIELINGTFSPQEAREVLLTILEDKVRFHNVKIIRGFETGTDTAASHKRIKELNASRIKVHEMVDKAIENSTELAINATISISTSVQTKVGQETN
ncbi:MAG: hypothetical protein H6601_08175 [Flavobacteriales bacterium]|nr:hypothetical protein [Flavobacteriales bacterium]